MNFGQALRTSERLGISEGVLDSVGLCTQQQEQDAHTEMATPRGSSLGTARLLSSGLRRAHRAPGSGSTRTRLLSGRRRSSASQSSSEDVPVTPRTHTDTDTHTRTHTHTRTCITRRQPPHVRQGLDVAWMSSPAGFYFMGVGGRGREQLFHIIYTGLRQRPEGLLLRGRRASLPGSRCGCHAPGGGLVTASPSPLNSRPGRASVRPSPAGGTGRFRGPRRRPDGLPRPRAAAIPPAPPHPTP